MQVNVAQLLREPAGATRSMELDGSILEWEGSPPAYLRGQLLLTKTDRGIWVSGPVGISLDGECSRCLVALNYWVDVQVDDEFLPSIDIVTGAKLRYDDESDAEVQAIDAQHVLDLTEVMGQYRRAAIPLAPLCREDCKGICPTCGTDLNENTCACEPALDPRWDKLKELLR